MSGWSSDDATPAPADPDRPTRRRRADSNPDHYDEQYGGAPEGHRPEDPYAEDPYAAQREAQYAAQHEDRHRQAPRPAGSQRTSGPADAWWNQPPPERPRRSSRRDGRPREPQDRPSQYEQPVQYDRYDAHDEPFDQEQPYRSDPGGVPVSPAEPTRPMVQGRRSRRQQPAAPEVAPADPTVPVHPYRPERSRGTHQPGHLDGYPDEYPDGYSDGYEPYDQDRDAPGHGTPGHGGPAAYDDGSRHDDGYYDDAGYDEGRDERHDRYDDAYDEDQPYFHPLDPETPRPRPSSRRGWRPPPQTPAKNPYDLSGLDPAELTGSLSLLGLEGPVVPADVTQPLQAIQAPIARSPRRPMPPAPPARSRRREREPVPEYDRGYAEPEVEEDYAEPEAAPAPAETKKPASRTSSLLGSSALMAAGTLASRLLGFVRAAVLVAVVAPGGGAGAADAFSVANIMPNALYILLAGGVLNAVLVPQIARAAKQKDGGEDYINRLLTAALGMLMVVTVGVILASPLLVKIYGSSKWDAELVSLTAAFSLWCLPQVFFYGLYTLLGQVLNARGKFGAFMWAPVMNNVVSIAGLVAFMVIYHKGTQPVDSWDATKIGLLAGSQTLGVAAQAVILIPMLSRAGVRYRPRFGLRGVGLASASKVAGWTFAAVVVQQIAFVVISQVTTTASKLLEDRPDAAIKTGKAIYDNAQLLFVLPHSLVAVSLVTALFTRMSNAAAENRIRDVRADLSLGLRLTGLATVVSTAGLLALGTDVTASMFPGNDRATTTGIGYVVMAMSLGLIPYSAQYLFQRVFYAFEDAKTPFFIQIAASATWATGNLISLFALRDRAPEYIVVGVGLSMALSNIVGAGLSYWILRQRFGDLDAQQVVRAHVEMIMVAAVGGVVAWLMAQSVHAFLGDGWLACIIAVVIGGVFLLTIYVSGMRMLGVKEIEDVAGPILRRLPSSPATLARHSAR
ncbi:murein biosynthesis integral membrane protein MurJ [Kineosporia sp. J2-2]|uniref:Murein biosynthesis integral membrane protein MurJ n=1 Tax=Kineosporia corallincola TaxID=2835133 RepID=A0ABS5TJL9_9ACTN|nr:murein biosynthesis integral membrane protein MurJ [Kineosporia corallincola]MBT0771282.1 murein biosynthesis integral membrane protein MurJ [Kineosporia corallincola]